jgi:plastocyanin
VRSSPFLRYFGAVLLLVGGLVHLQLYFDGYRDFPNENLGRSFLLNAAASVAVAALLFLRRDTLVRLAGVAIAAGTLVAFALSRTGDGIFGFTESGLNPSPQASIALLAEIGAIAVLLASLAVERPNPSHERASGGTLALLAAVASVVVAVALGAAWSRGPQPASAAPSKFDPSGMAPMSETASEVAIQDFAFGPKELSVAAGTTVTWTNSDGFAHSVISQDGVVQSEQIAPGGTFTFTFDGPGTYAYFCGIHNSMKASITVT